MSTKRRADDQGNVKFVFCKPVPEKYHDYGTHSSCRSDGLIVFIWSSWHCERISGNGWVEIGAIIHQMYMRDDVSGSDTVFKPNPNYAEGTGGGLLPEALDSIKKAIEQYSDWWELSDGQEYRIYDDFLAGVG